MIDFGYKNRTLLEKLWYRGIDLTYGYIGNLKKREDEINEYIAKNASDLERPMKAFVIFNRDEDYELCSEYLIQRVKGKTKQNFFFEGEELFLRQAPEPSDVIWENA